MNSIYISIVIDDGQKVGRNVYLLN